MLSPSTRRQLLAAVERFAVGQDGRSGARVERVRLDDGRTVVVKRTNRSVDRAAIVTDGDGREAELFLRGVLDRLPHGVAHAVLDAWRDGDDWVIAMRDVSSGLVPNEHTATHAEVARFLRALTAVHRAFADAPRPDGLCPLDAMLRNLAPQQMALLAQREEFARLVVRGWEIFHDTVPSDVSAHVAAVHDGTEPILDRMSTHRASLLHGDPWLVNCALLPTEVVLLDWALATWGPPAVDLAVFLAGHGARMAPSREEVIAQFLGRSGDLTTPDALRLALVHGLALMGWNKALDAREHRSEAVRERERADLRWWVEHFDPP